MKFKLVIDKGAEEEVVVFAHEKNELIAQIENLVLSYTGKQRISVWKGEDMVCLSLDEIECITVIKRKVFVIDCKGIQYRSQQRLCDFEEILPSNFIRINKSTIANENSIVQFKTVYTGAVDAIFKCGYQEYVSRRCFSEIRRRLEGK